MSNTMSTLMTHLRVEDAAIFVDVDVNPIPANEGGRVKPSVRKPTLRRVLRRLKGRLALVSGRAMADVDRLLGGAVTCICGSHGLQRRTSDEGVIAFAPHPRLGDIIRAAIEFSNIHNGLKIDVKPLGVAFHMAEHPELTPLVRQFCERWAQNYGLDVIEGDAVMEIRTPGATKGDAVRAYLTEAPFNGTVPVYIGRDLSDEKGFAAAIEHGGFGILVGEPRHSLARYRLNDFAAVHAWLNNAVRRGEFDLNALAVV